MEIPLSTLQKLVGKKAPIVGIPRPVGKPFAVERATLAGLIQGLESCEIKLNAHLEIEAPSRHYMLKSLDMQRQAAFYRMLRAWAARLRAKRAAPKLSREERRKADLLRKIAIAERKADQMRVHYQPYNPTLESGEKAGDYEREQWAAWIAQKPTRRRIGTLATAHGLNHGYVPQAVISRPRHLYEALAGLIGHDVRKYGELRSKSRGEKPTEAEYLKHLYEYAAHAFQSNPYQNREWRTPEHVRKDRLDYCQRMRDWRNAQETVNWLRAQLSSFDGAKEEGDDLH